MRTKSSSRAELKYIAEDGTPVTTTVQSADAARLSRALPVRGTRSYAGQRHYSGLFWSATTSGHVRYESLLELDRLWLADFDPEVAWIAAQPMWIRQHDGERTRRHAPDFLLTRDNGQLTVVDVKPAGFAALPEVAEVFDWTRSICAERGWRYEVWTGGNPTRIANIRALGAARRLQLFANSRPPAGKTFEDAFVARFRAWSGQTVVDLDTPLTNSALTGTVSDRSQHDCGG